MARTAPPPPTAGDSSSESDESSLASDSESSSDEDEPVVCQPVKTAKVAPKAKAPKAKAKPPPSVVAGWTPSVAPAEPPRALHHLHSARRRRRAASRPRRVIEARIASPANPKTRPKKVLSSPTKSRDLAFLAPAQIRGNAL